MQLVKMDETKMANRHSKQVSADIARFLITSLSPTKQILHLFA